MFYVYTYIDPRNNSPFYVGKGLHKRITEMQNRSKSFLGRIRILKEKSLKSIIHKIPIENENEAFELEKFLIKLIGRRDLNEGTLLNHTDGGEGVSGSIRSEECIERQRNSIIKTMNTPEMRAKMAAVHKGKKLSDETRAKMSQSRKEYYKKNKHVLLGRKFSNEEREHFRVLSLDRLRDKTGRFI